jgi:glucose dehydrogenase
MEMRLRIGPHDEFDWDSVQVPVLADIPWQGKPAKLMLWVNRNGFFYVIDRTTGKFLLGKPFVKQNWNIGFDPKGRPIVQALDPQTGESKWDFRMVNYTESGVLSTASDLVFSGGLEGNFFALDARDGSCLWKVALGGTVSSGPISYSVDGHQYVAIAAKGALYAFALPQ